MVGIFCLTFDVVFQNSKADKSSLQHNEVIGGIVSVILLKHRLKPFQRAFVPRTFAGLVIL